MEIVYNTSENVKDFGNLEIGSVFNYDGEVYLKFDIGDSLLNQIKYNAINISSNERALFRHNVRVSRLRTKLLIM